MTQMTQDYPDLEKRKMGSQYEQAKLNPGYPNFPRLPTFEETQSWVARLRGQSSG